MSRREGPGAKNDYHSHRRDMRRAQPAGDRPV